MLVSLTSGGEGVRPLLVTAAARSLNNPRSSAINSRAAIQMSLHDNNLMGSPKIFLFCLTNE